MNKTATIAAALAFMALAIPALVVGQTYAGDVGIEKDDVKIGAKEYSPYLNRAHPDRVLWGDTHLHTSYSTDAGMIGNYLGPDDAFRFARGEIVRASGGQRARLIRPLDFLVVADHSENLGLAPLIAESDPNLLSIPWGKEIHDLVKAGDVGETNLDQLLARDDVNASNREKVRAFFMLFDQMHESKTFLVAPSSVN